jgi:hypothetical protein
MNAFDISQDEDIQRLRFVEKKEEGSGVEGESFEI